MGAGFVSEHKEESGATFRWNLVPFQLNSPSGCMDALAKNLEGTAHGNGSKYLERH